MKHKILAKWHSRKNLFVHLLANEKKGKVSQNLKIWAYYRLGMFNYVIATESKKLNARAYVAKIVSCAALGELEKSRVLIGQFNTCKSCQYQGALLLKALTPYMSELVLSWENKVKISSALKVALLCKVGEKQKALLKIEKLLVSKAYRKTPELLLIKSNLLEEMAPQKKITFLNKYLLQYGLTKVRLKDPQQALSVMNITAHSKQYMDENSLVTVIMTTYNSSETVASAIDSVLLQSYSNIELIVVDDCSRDSTVEIVKTFEQLDDRVKLIRLDKNVGTYVAKNLALGLAKGKFITCHDSDDYSHPRKIELQVEPMIKDKKLVASISDWVRVDEKGNYYSRYVYPFMRMNLSSLMFRKDKVVSKVGFYDSVRTGADSEYYARIGLAFGKRSIKRVKKPLSFGAHRENSLMTAKGTGYNETGISYNRQEYWESWNNWHIHKISFKKIPYIGFDEKSVRPFDVPKDLEVERNDIKLVKKQVKDKNV